MTSRFPFDLLPATRHRTHIHILHQSSFYSRLVQPWTGTREYDALLGRYAHHPERIEDLHQASRGTMNVHGRRSRLSAEKSGLVGISALRPDSPRPARSFSIDRATTSTRTPRESRHATHGFTRHPRPHRRHESMIIEVVAVRRESPRVGQAVGWPRFLHEIAPFWIGPTTGLG